MQASLIVLAPVFLLMCKHPWKLKAAARLKVNGRAQDKCMHVDIERIHLSMSLVLHFHSCARWFSACADAQSKTVQEKHKRGEGG